MSHSDPILSTENSVFHCVAHFPSFVKNRNKFIFTLFRYYLKPKKTFIKTLKFEIVDGAASLIADCLFTPNGEFDS